MTTAALVTYYPLSRRLMRSQPPVLDLPIQN